MPRIVHNRLSALKVSRLRDPGTYADGQGLYLVISSSGSKSWMFRYVSNGRAREMGLGPERDVSLADARDSAAALRRQRREGTDPADARKASKVEVKRDRAGMTFKACAERYIEENKSGWKNAKHADQWTNTLVSYAFPHLGQLTVASVEVDDVLKVLQPIWEAKAETASRVRGRIETVLDFAKARGWRSGDNPAAWRGHLQRILPPKARVAVVRHHAAMPYAATPAFVAQLREATGSASRALEFAILTAARTGEVIGATWPEIDVQARTWTVPPARMKGRREHRVPLCDRAMAILDEAAVLGREGFVFPGGKRGKGLSNMAMDAVLRRANRDVTVHGFRSSFRDWAADQTAFPREVAEACLAHALRDATEAAYRRSDLLDRRRQLLAAWEAFLDAEPATAAVEGGGNSELAAHLALSNGADR